MSAVCANCDRAVVRYTLKLCAKGLQCICSSCANPSQQSCVNPFQDLVLEHAHNEQGKPIHVTSLRQLREAEKQYHFRSIVANEREADFDKPPQSQHGDLFRSMTEESRWLYPEVAEPMLAEMRESGEI